MTGNHVLLRWPKEGEETLIVYLSDMGNTATTHTDTGTDLDTRYGYHVKAKNAHGLSDVSTFARVHTGRRNSTLKNAAHQPGGCTMRRRYSRFTARLTVAGDTPKDLATRRWLAPLPTISMTAASCSPDHLRGAPSFLPSAFAFSKPALVRRRMDTSSWSDTQAAKPARV